MFADKLIPKRTLYSMLEQYIPKIRQNILFLSIAFEVIFDFDQFLNSRWRWPSFVA